MVRGLQSRGFELYFHHAGRDGGVIPVDPSHGVSWPMGRFKTVSVPEPGFRRRIRWWLRRYRPDLVHVSLSFSLQDGWLGRQAGDLGMGRVATFHLPFGRPGSARAWVMHELHRFWVPRLRGYQKVIVFSADHARQLARLGLNPGALEILPNAVDTDAFSPRPGAGAWDGRTLILGYAGRLDPEKGIQDLLDGYLRAGLGRRAELRIAGDGSLTPLVERAAARHPGISYAGRLVGLQERVDFWRDAQLFCL
ncbi:MAG: glycosyltransferase family 4 protein, partial [Candidatus Dormibacteria bacterium]